MFKTAIVGLSRQGVKHLLAVLQHPKFELVAICDANEETLLNASLQFSVQGFSNVISMLDKTQLDVLILCLPHDQYSEVIAEAFPRGIHILKEKPFACNMAEARNWLTKARKFKVYLGIAAQRRFHPSYQLAKLKLSSITNPYHISLVHRDNLPYDDSGWRGKVSRAGGGVLLDLGYHYVDLLQWYFGLPAEVYQSIKLTKGSVISDLNSVEDTISTVIRFKNDIICQLFLSRESLSQSENIMIYGTGKHIFASRNSFQMISDNGVNPVRSTCLPNWSLAMDLQLSDFATLLTGNPDSLTNAVNHVKTMELINMINCHLPQKAFDLDKIQL